jgi:hypothetical protein
MTTRKPLELPVGTGTTIWVLLQLVGVVVTQLNVTVLDPCDEPKFAPLIVTGTPISADVGDTPRIAGDVSVKASPLLSRFDTITITFPELVPAGTGATICVLLQLVAVVVTSLNATVLDPCAEPKLVPVIVTAVPAGPTLGDKLVRFGDAVVAPTL